MKLTALNALVAAVEEGSLRAAARRLGVAQPALTKQMRELERELATPLLARATTGVAPTAQGKVLYEHAKRMAREMAEAVQQIQQLGGQMVGDLSIGAVPAALVMLMPEALRTYGAQFPQIRLQVSEELYTAQLTKLRTGEVDLAVGPIPEGLPPGEYSAEPLMPLTMAVVVRKGSPYARARTLARLADARWVYTSTTGAAAGSQSGGATGYARQLFQAHGLPPPQAGVVVNSTLAQLAALTSADHAALMPSVIADHAALAPLLVKVPLREPPLVLTLGVLARADTLLRPAARHFIAHLQRAAHHAQGGQWKSPVLAPR